MNIVQFIILKIPPFSGILIKGPSDNLKYSSWIIVLLQQSGQHLYSASFPYLQSFPLHPNARQTYRSPLSINFKVSG